MKKLYSLIKATMTSDMNLFRIKTKKNNKSSLLIPIFIALYLMFVLWGSANAFFEKLASLDLQVLLLPLCVFGISIMTIIEGIYKSSSLIFNSKDDDLLLSLPIKRSTVLFIRIFKFYVFELLFNSLFILPVMIAYIKWANYLNWTYYLTSFIMLLILPLIPIVISCFIGFLITSLSSKFRFKNIAQILTSMLFLILVLIVSFNSNNIMDYLIKHVNSINDLIIKIYYPAGIYIKLVTNFNIIDLIVFIIINLGLFTISIYLLSLVYFKINSRIKKISSNNVKFNKLVIKKKNKYISLIRKELNTFFKTPVFIINSGFGLVLFIIGTILISLRFDKIINILTTLEDVNISKELITNNLSILILILILITAFMTSITNSVISLEGRSINILKSLPINTKTILISKILTGLSLTTPILLVGDIILFIRFKTKVIEVLLLIILSILIPLVSHFIGLIFNLKYPKLDYENTTEVVKQSMSSFISVITGMILLIINVTIILNVVGLKSINFVLLTSTIVYIFIDIILYFYLMKIGVREFNNLII